jgi:dipeptidyl aminopeptidase/acylaminoacyl peptidase
VLVFLALAAVAGAQVGRRVAFVSNHDKNWERARNNDVFVVDAKPGSKSRQLTTSPGADGGSLAWSPDGALIVFGQGSEPKFDFHNMSRLAVVPYGGVLTDYMIASDTRFKAAISGAGSANHIFLVRPRSVSIPVRQRVWRAVEESVALARVLLSVLPCRQDSHADALPRRTGRLQCADPWRAEPRPHQDELPARSLRALSGVVRQVFEERRRDKRRSSSISEKMKAKWQAVPSHHTNAEVFRTEDDHVVAATPVVCGGTAADGP